MIVFRLCKDKYSTDLSGKGAELYGGRWNKKGTALLYTSESRALSVAELSVHLPFGMLPINFVMVSIEIPDILQKEIISLNNNDLPKNWDTFPYSLSTETIGSNFIQKNNLILKTPSVVVKGDFNYLINPLHKDFTKITIKKKEPFNFDSRLLHLK